MCAAVDLDRKIERVPGRRLQCKVSRSLRKHGLMDNIVRPEAKAKRVPKTCSDEHQYLLSTFYGGTYSFPSYWKAGGHQPRPSRPPPHPALFRRFPLPTLINSNDRDCFGCKQQNDTCRAGWIFRGKDYSLLLSIQTDVCRPEWETGIPAPWPQLRPPLNKGDNSHHIDTVDSLPYS